MRALVVFDKFKDSLTARAACAAAVEALGAMRGDWTVDVCPLADGGEGFAEILTEAAHGTMATREATGPRGRMVTAGYGLVPLGNIPTAARAQLQIPTSAPASDRVAVVEMAAVSGLALLGASERDAWQATSRGTGELLAAAAGEGAVAILLGVGGSATSDLGLGALAALGMAFRNRHGELVTPPVPASWPEIATVAGEVPPAFPPIRIACDVSNPLLGSNGAAAVYGPQKGLPLADVDRLDREAGRLARLLAGHCGRSEASLDQPGAGAAGGIAFGLMTAARAVLLPGFELVEAWLDLDARLAAADVVITGEGRFDASSLSGKGPGAIVQRALERRKRVHVFAGQVTAHPNLPGLTLHTISPAGQPLEEALRRGRENLTTAVLRVAERL